MSSAAAIRLQIETNLAQRVPPAAPTLKVKQAPELFSTGIWEIDGMLGGGIPRGSITEISGPASSGKTSFGLSAVAAMTQAGHSCAWVDVSDALSPEKGTVKDVQGVMGHTRLATTTDVYVYMQPIPESVRATVDSLDRGLQLTMKKLSGGPEVLPSTATPATAMVQ